MDRVGVDRMNGGRESECNNIFVWGTPPIKLIRPAFNVPIPTKLCAIR